jgi:hypothetical protein
MGASVAWVLPAYFWASPRRRQRRRKNILLSEEWSRRERWASGKVAKTSWRENKSDGDVELRQIRGLVSAVLGKWSSLYSRSGAATVIQTSRCIWWWQHGARQWSAREVSVAWSWLRRRWRRDIPASYGRGTEKDGVQRSEESTVMVRIRRRTKGIRLLGSWLQLRKS